MIAMVGILLSVSGFAGVISSVTRPTIQLPPASTIQVLTNLTASPALNQSVPVVIVIPAPPPRIKSQAEQEEETKRIVAFQKHCAEEGLPGFQYEWGLRCLKGNGVDQDIAEGRKWLKRAADQGHEKARKKLEDLGPPETQRKEPSPVAVEAARQ